MNRFGRKSSQSLPQYFADRPNKASVSFTEEEVCIRTISMQSDGVDQDFRPFRNEYSLRWCPVGGGRRRNDGIDDGELGNDDDRGVESKRFEEGCVRVNLYRPESAFITRSTLRSDVRAWNSPRSSVECE